MIHALNNDLVVVSGMMNLKVPVLDVVNRSRLKLWVLSGCWQQTMYCHLPGKCRSPHTEVPVDRDVAVDLFTSETRLKSTVLSI